MIKQFLFLIIFLGAFHVTAAQKAKTKPVSEDPLVLSVYYGDKITAYQIVKTESGGKIVYTSSNGKQLEKPVTKKNYDYFLSEFNRIQDGNKKEFCPRNYIEMKQGAKTHLGCIGSATSAAKKLTFLSSAITLLL